MYLENNYEDDEVKAVIEEHSGANVFIRKSSDLDPTCKDPQFLINFKSHCGYDIDDGGWKLVRHAPNGTEWHKSTDKLHGIDIYGDASGGPEGDAAWSVDFESTMEQYDEVLLASGNCKEWLILNRREIGRGSGIFIMLFISRSFIKYVN